MVAVKVEEMYGADLPKGGRPKGGEKPEATLPQVRADQARTKAARQLSVSAGGSFPRIWGKQRGAR